MSLAPPWLDVLTANAADAVANEIYQMIGYFVAFDVAATLDFPRHVFRQIVGPMFERVERENADRIAEAPRHQIGDDAFEIASFHRGLPRPPLRPRFDDQIDGLIGAIRHDRRSPTGPEHGLNSCAITAIQRFQSGLVPPRQFRLKLNARTRPLCEVNDSGTDQS